MKFPVPLAASIIYLLTICASICAHSFEWTTPQGVSCTKVLSCGGKDDVMQNVKVTLSPDPPQLNNNLTITIDADLTKEITKGTTIGARYTIDGEVKRPFRDADFCALLPLFVNLTCPLKPGPLHVPLVFPIHNISPDTTYGAYANATDQDGVQMFCIFAHCIVTQ